MTFLLLIFAITLIWTFVTGSYTLPNVLLGAVVASLATVLIRGRIERPHIARRAWRVVGLLWMFLVELVLSATRVAFLVVTPNLRKRLSSKMFAYPLTVTSDIEITLLANLITLTPGTLSVDVSEDRATLLVHALEMTDESATIAAIRNGFEKKIMEVFAP